MLGLYTVAIASLSFVVKQIIGSEEISVGSMSLSLDKLPVFAFPDIWHNLAYVAKYFNAFLAIIVIIFITNELEFRTLRQSIINGLNRVEFIISKLLLMLGLSLFATAVVFLTSLSIGLTQSDPDAYGSIWKGVEFIPAFGLYSFAHMLFASLFGLFIRRSGIAISLFLLYSFMLENIAHGLLKWNLKLEWLVDYLPLNAIGNLIQLPFGKYLLRLTQEHVALNDVLICCIYIVGFLGLFYWWIKKKDW